jgi:hypothetical protein
MMIQTFGENVGGAPKLGRHSADESEVSPLDLQYAEDLSAESWLIQHVPQQDFCHRYLARERQGIADLGGHHCEGWWARAAALESIVCCVTTGADRAGAWSEEASGSARA